MFKTEDCRFTLTHGLDVSFFRNLLCVVAVHWVDVFFFVVFRLRVVDQRSSRFHFTHVIIVLNQNLKKKAKFWQEVNQSDAQSTNFIGIALANKQTFQRSELKTCGELCHTLAVVLTAVP